MAHSGRLALLGLLLAGVLAVPALAGDDKPPPPPPGDKPADPAKPGDPAKPPDNKPPDVKAVAKPAPPTEEEVTAFLKDWETRIPKMKEEETVPALKKLGGWYTTLEAFTKGKEAASPEVKAAEALQRPILDAVARSTKVKSETTVEEAAKQLGTIGEPAVPHLKALVSARLDDKVPPPKIIKAGLLSLGKIASPKDGDVKFLTDLFNNKDNDVISKVAQALGGYEKAPGKVRQHIVGEILKKCEGTYNAAQGGKDPDQRAKWNSWGVDMVESMQKVAHRPGLKTPKDFREWMNDKGPNGGKNPKTWSDAPPPDKGAAK